MFFPDAVEFIELKSKLIFPVIEHMHSTSAFTGLLMKFVSREHCNVKDYKLSRAAFKKTMAVLMTVSAFFYKR